MGQELKSWAVRASFLYFTRGCNFRAFAGFYSPMKFVILFFILALPLSAQRRGPDHAPKVGDAIPKAAALTLKDQKKVDLSKPEKITVLIFGSHT